MVENEGEEQIPSEILSLLEDATFEIALLTETVKVLTASGPDLPEILDSFLKVAKEEVVH